MTAITSCKFNFNYKNGLYPGLRDAPLEFEITLPELHPALQSELYYNGPHRPSHYMGQVRWNATNRIRRDLPGKLMVFVHGDVNPHYNAALLNLFGSTAGRVLLLDGEDFIIACQAQWDKDQRNRNPLTPTSTIAERILEELTSVELGQRVVDELITKVTHP